MSGEVASTATARGAGNEVRLDLISEESIGSVVTCTVQKQQRELDKLALEVGSTMWAS